MNKVLCGLALVAAFALLSGSAQAQDNSELNVVVTVSIAASASVDWMGATDPVSLSVNFTALSQQKTLTIPDISCASQTGSGVTLAASYTNATGCDITVTPPAALAAGASGPVTGSVTSPVTLGEFTAGTITATITATVQ